MVIGNDCNDFDIYGNTFTNWHHACFVIQASSAGSKITNIKFHDNICSGSNIDYGRGFLYNIAGAVGVGVCTGNEIYNNLFYDFEANSQISGDGLKLYNNIFDGTRECESRIDVVENLLKIQAYYGTTINNEIYNNVFANSYVHGINLVGSGNYPTYDNIIANNIFYNNGNSDDIQLLTYWWSHVGRHDYKNNLFYKSGESVLVQYGNLIVQGEVSGEDNSKITVPEFNSWDGLAGDVISGNIEGDPLFVDATNANYSLRDYHLQSGSPAIGAGVAISGITHDKDGVVYSDPPSIGAFEYTG